MEKKFKLSKEEIKQIIDPIGGCIATDRILIDGKRVGFMYREEPDFKSDSGWRFMTGDETQEYMDDPNNSGIYDVNTIANYDNAIVKYLSLPIGTELIRTGRKKFKIEK